MNRNRENLASLDLSTSSPQGLARMGWLDIGMPSSLDDRMFMMFQRVIAAEP